MFHGDLRSFPTRRSSDLTAPLSISIWPLVQVAVPWLVSVSPSRSEGQMFALDTLASAVSRTLPPHVSLPACQFMAPETATPALSCNVPLVFRLVTLTAFP